MPTLRTNKSNNKRDTFRFWFPIDKLEKGVDKDGNVNMVIGGIASTGRKDTDEEMMDTDGFQLDYLEERGIINWNHGTKPEHVIGEPTKIENRDEGLYVESMLYPNKKLAKSAYELAETLKKHSKKRRLGYSIEGKVLSRDPNDPRKVKKALITNLALTISPKNADSIVDIIKGQYHEVEDYEFEVDSPVDSSIDFDQAIGGKVYIIDITRPDGTRVTVDTDLNIAVNKSLDTTAGKPLVKESVDKNLKDLSKSNKYLTWEECIQRIKSANSVIDVEKANIFVEKLNNLAMATKNSKTTITDDLLSKALANVGILDKKTLKKGAAVGDDDDDDVEDEDDDEQESKGKKVAKGHKKETDSEEEDEEDNEDEEEEEKPMKKTKKPIKKSNTNKRLTAVTVVDDETAELVKSVGIIGKACLDEIKALRKENTLIKGQVDDLTEQLEEVLTTSTGRKSLSKPVNKNFKKSIGADNDEEDEADDVRTLSLTRDKGQILEMLDDTAFNKGNVNNLARREMSAFEISNTISKSMLKQLEKDYKVQFVQ